MESLVGSEKQVAWANKIRMSFLPEIERYVERCAEVGRAIDQEVYQSIRTEASAKWWIDHRSDSPQLLFHKMSKKG